MSQKFYILELQALRKEILSIKSKLRKEFVAGLIGIPILIGSADRLGLEYISLVLPISIVAGTLMLLFEQSSVMRAGHYIRCHIETLLSNKNIGWEKWLESEKANRDPSNLFRVAITITFLLYYSVALWFAHKGSQNLFNNNITVVISIIYTAGLLFFIYYLLQQWKTHATLSSFCNDENFSGDENSSFYDNNRLSVIDREFLEKEYCCLREEIIGLKERVFKMFSVGLLGLPALTGVSVKFEINLLQILSPVITVAVALVIVCIQNNIMIAGRYIRTEVEPRLKEKNGFGWENFLETKNAPTRLAETYFLISTLLALGIFYLVGTAISYNVITNNYGDYWGLVALVLYGSCFLFFIYFVSIKLQTSTKRKKGS